MKEMKTREEKIGPKREKRMRKQEKARQKGQPGKCMAPILRKMASEMHEEPGIFSMAEVVVL